MRHHPETETADLTIKGTPAAVEKALVSLRGILEEFYRVRLGPIESVDKADAVLARVVGAGNTNARVIVD